MPKSVPDFTYRKFLRLPQEKQHRFCAELLHLSVSIGLPSDLLDAYHEWAKWMELSPLPSPDKKVVADRFHWHQQQAGVPMTERHLLPTVVRGDNATAQPTWPIAIVLERLRSAHNVGSILRTTEAFSLGTLYFSQNTPNLDHPQVKKTAMGTESWVATQPLTSWDSLPHPIIALETCEEATSLHDFTFPPSFSLVVGNEEDGLSEETLQKADIVLSIPLRGRKNSLNVANAFAIAAAEIVRQKQCETYES